MGKNKFTVLAVDLGAESGRVLAVFFDGNHLQFEELHRFRNPTTVVNQTLHWDFLHLWREVQAGIRRGKHLNPASIGVDTWGVDFGLLDAEGNLIGNPVHYRDKRTDGMMARTFAKVPQREIFAQTGIQFLPINSLYQMMSMVERQSPQLRIAETFLTAPDLINYWLTGAKVCEFSNATTTQMFNPISGKWAVHMLEKLGIPVHIFPEVVPPGTKLGYYDGIPVIAPACHDTGSAVAAVPAQTPNFAYISSGTWSLVGLEMDEPIINDASFAANVTNEGGVFGTFRLLKNVTGLWILRQCRQTWALQGEGYSYAELVDMARSAPPLQFMIDPNDHTFLPPGDHPQKVADFCVRTGQHVPTTKEEIVRCVLDSLALTYRSVIETLHQLTQQPIEVLHIVGGGTQNELLNQLTANATGLPVVTGPIEAAVTGNALVQLIALGEIDNLSQGRQIISDMGEQKRYQPEDGDEWQAAYARYKDIQSR